ncbi:unnamed protein product [Musa acuminata subsp. malaccensis]|uniref:(wild Malaysian banana) hypothetical protein n=1 Tax=Musa acuminata subsp. malaccensis TaxID=214687 RepID=A0A804HRN4_MUSAM|nr:PREDICTED: GATA transcription factor 16-like [Musa acuminata subsp. malaccensis]CAG1858912.1 unnamed protein product [Musa acuminata subsp. malaccensis]
MDDPTHEMPSMDASSSDCQLKCCADCRTTKTPLWRAGPSGPKSLCNACGIRYRKNGRALPVSKKKKVEIGSGGGEGFGGVFQASEAGVGFAGARTMIQKQRRRGMLGEEEAAVSAGFLYA